MAILLTVPAGTVVTSEEVYALDTSLIRDLMAAVNVTAVSGTSPSLQIYVEVLGSDGVWYEVWKPSAITAAGQSIGAIGPGFGLDAVFPAQSRLRFEATGTSPSFTLSASVNGTAVP